MAEKDVAKILNNKSLELKKYLKTIGAMPEQWKFSIEDTKEGTRIELHVVALLKRQKK